MKYIKLILVSVLALMAVLPLHAQWNGVNTEVTLVRKKDNSQQVQIGTPDSDNSSCYEWSGPNIIGDVHQPVVTVNPQNVENVYLVRRKSSCGVEEGQVIVHLSDTISLVSVTPKRECYNVGERFKLEDFDFETDPPGYESCVQFYGAKDTAYVAPGVTAASDEVQFILSYNNHNSFNSAEVLVYNIYEHHDSPISVTPEFSDLKNKITKIKNLVTGAQEVTNTVQSVIPPGTSPCQTDFNVSGLSLPMPSFFRSCCEGKERFGFYMSIPVMEGKFNLDCSFPTSVGIPHVGGIFVILGLEASASVGPLELYYRGPQCISGTLHIGLGISVYGGVKIMAVDDDFFSGSLKLVGSAAMGWDWLIGEELKFNGLDVTISVEGEIVLFSLATIKASGELFKTTFFNE